MNAHPRGRLRIYLGYAAGVGKTFSMLNEGHRRRDRGTDVVIGVVETHGRAHTQEQIGDLEVVPRLEVDYRGGTFEEMDLDGILRRAPDVVLVDELAHTNVPCSRHEKRWQDVEALLDAGIDVISTLNIQHLESLNDVTERITGVRQRETIPDEVVRRADQQELVDMTPQALQRRMAHGNVYPPERVDAALSNYFREGNLGALRELALLWVADRVDDELQGYMRDHGIEGPWDTRERILVGVSGRPEDGLLIRRASRMAARRAGELHAVYVIPEDGGPVSSSLDATRELVRSTGGVFHQVVGASIPGALVQFARAENITQIVIGASSHSRWRAFTHGSVVHRVIRESGPIDVHVISQAARSGGAQPADASRRIALPRRRQAVGAVVAAGGVVLLTAVLTTVREGLGLTSIFLLYLSLVVVVAAIGGLWVAMGAAVGSSLVLNWYFTPPIHTWTIADTDNLLALLVFTSVGAVVSVLVDRAARLRKESQRARSEAEALARLAGWLVAEDDPLQSLLEHLRTTLGLQAVSIFRRTDVDAWSVEASAGDPETVRSGQEGDRIDLGEDAVLVMKGSHLRVDERRVLTAFAAQLAVAVRGRELQAEIAEAADVAAVNDLRAAILAAVSHDLRTPLASIKAAVSSLRQDDVSWTRSETSEFLATIEEEADRLGSLVGNLLDMSRIQTGALRLVRRLTGLDEIVPNALASLPDHGRSVQVDVPETLPRVDVDAALLERAVANVVGNASAWSVEAHEPVRVTGSTASGRVELRVIDRGPGIPQDQRDRVFEPFQQLGDRSSSDGVGLGLAVARGFVQAMGGEIRLEDTPGGGLTMVLSFGVAA